MCVLEFRDCLLCHCELCAVHMYIEGCLSMDLQIGLGINCKIMIQKVILKQGKFN